MNADGVHAAWVGGRRYIIRAEWHPGYPGPPLRGEPWAEIQSVRLTHCMRVPTNVEFPRPHEYPFRAPMPTKRSRDVTRIVMRRAYGQDIMGTTLWDALCDEWAAAQEEREESLRIEEED